MADRRILIYTNDVKYLMNKVKEEATSHEKFKHLNDNDAIHDFVNFKLKELRSKNELPEFNSKKPIKSPSVAWLKKAFENLSNDSIGADYSLNYDSINPICIVIENKVFEERFIQTNKIKSYLNPPGKEEKIYARYPEHNPCFPASPTQLLNLNISGLKTDLNDYLNIYVKDESKGNTGTHKDRMALEILNWYNNKVSHNSSNPNYVSPSLSLLTYGCAGMAIQSILGEPNKFNPNGKNRTRLKLLVPNTIDKKIVKALENIDAKVYKHDLTEKELNSKQILELTDNTNATSSYDLTFGNRYDNQEKIDIKSEYYNYLAWEIINTSATYIFMPYGSGDLYYNVLKRLDKEIHHLLHETNQLLYVKPERLGEIILIGSTIGKNNTGNDESIKMITDQFDKLYSPYFGENNNIKLCEKIVKKGNVNKKCQIVDLTSENIELLEDAKKIMAENRIDSENSGLSGLLTFLSKKDELEIKPEDKVLIVNTGKLKFEQYLDNK